MSSRDNSVKNPNGIVSPYYKKNLEIQIDDEEPQNVKKIRIKSERVNPDYNLKFKEYASRNSRNEEKGTGISSPQIKKQRVDSIDLTQGSH
jgi:hypothetical protein